MAQTPSTWDDYVGDGVEDTFQITFPYQKQQEVFVTVDGAPAAFTFISAGWVQLAAAPANGAAIRVQRSTEASEPRHEFANGVPLLPRFIDENNKQFLYVAQEAMNETVAVTAEVQEAVNKTAAITAEARAVAEGVRAVAEEARAMAEGAVDIAQAASDKVDAAVIESAHQLRLNLADSTDPAKGAGMVGYKGRTVAQELDALGTAATRNAQVSPTDDTAGALLAVGAFGLGGLNAHISGTSLDALSKTGFYMGNHLANAPLASTGWFYVLHQEHGGAGYSSQIAIDLTSPTPKTYQRQKTGGTWGSWYEVWNGSALPVTAFAKTLLDDADAAAARATLGAVSSTDVDAKFTGTNASLSENGFQKIIGGLILQWGTVSVPANSSISVVFPVAFTTACYGVQLQNTEGTVSLKDGEAVTSITAIGFTAWNGAGSALGMPWFALGK